MHCGISTRTNICISALSAVIIIVYLSETECIVNSISVNLQESLFKSKATNQHIF